MVSSRLECEASLGGWYAGIVYVVWSVPRSVGDAVKDKTTSIIFSVCLTLQRLYGLIILNDLPLIGQQLLFRIIKIFAYLSNDYLGVDDV